MTPSRSPSAPRRRARSARRGTKQGLSVAERQLALLQSRPAADAAVLGCARCGEVLCGCPDAAWNGGE